ncbi:ABC transporter permease [Longispora albida]|uniref:ABC transporter permease n=1 Tax=Longispora albida TaxID=203523 RepID=UPI0003617C38|nr:ABC transporter permease [Longispora albida]
MLTMVAQAKRASALFERNVVVYKRLPWNIVSGFFEPVLYLFSIGIGVGALVSGTFTVDGEPMSYALFVAPAMMAQSAMSGAMIESAFNLFGKMRYQKLYDAFLATPVGPNEIAWGELSFALARGGAYSAAFLVVMAVMDLTTSWWAVLALPGALLIGLAFGGLGMAIATFLRSWQDFDYVTGIMYVMFLFSGTFAPIALFPAWAQWLVQVTPLYHGVELLRGLTTGQVGPGLIGHAVYLAALAAIGLTIASRRMGKLLLK